MTDKILVLTTCASEEEAERIARELVERRLSACVNVIGGIRSTYRWQGTVESAAEALLVIKASQSVFAPLRAAIEELHSYEVPEVLALPVLDGSERYLAWLGEQLRA